ncbi:hypothetical protein CP965_02350 [Halarcobacter mediterraneus]|uniref:Lipoprotein n=1 Tax=Halarcobacter mediterraneus TaxID=2023153 RepID=A0A4Q1B007_9BACT|nr:hypothetical protein [Halarcobacter mediterraneus]RXK14312.1 hypothetical protein CP965_02350 [Halarcobacter mediterraneus]
MNIINSFLLLLSLTFFAACSDKTTALNHFEKDKYSAKAIQYTKKRDLLDNGQVEALVFLTYLNKISDKYDEKGIETFILGIQLANKEKENLFKDEFKLFLNKQKSFSIENLDANTSSLVQGISLKSPWAKYFLIKFENKKNNRDLNLKFIHSRLGQTFFTFRKE